MNILNLSAVDYGGAGQMAFQFHELFLSQGHQSMLIVKDSKSNKPVGVYKRKLIHKFNVRWFKWKHAGREFDDKYHFYNQYEGVKTVSVKKLLKLCPFKPDVVFLYWISDFINAKSIRKLSSLTGARIYWLMIDNAPITGGCHYPWDCKGYQIDCDECPAIISTSAKKFAKDILNLKLQYLPDDLSLVVFSQNDNARAVESSVFRYKSIYKILGWADDNKYFPGDKMAAKSHFGIKGTSQIVFFGAASLMEKRKGMKLLLDAFNLIHSDDIILLAAGNTDKLNISDKKIKMLGYLNEDQLIKAYQAADVFVCSSIEDSGPMMINQSIMCGTPVVAFNMGVARDLVHTGKTGYRAKLGDPDDLANGIRYILTLGEIEYQQMSVKCRELAVTLYGTDKFRSEINKLLLLS